MSGTLAGSVFRVFREGGELFDRLLKQSGGNLPTAILAHNDQMRLAVMRRIHELGLSVPGDFVS